MQLYAYTPRTRKDVLQLPRTNYTITLIGKTLTKPPEIMKIKMEKLTDTV